MALIQLKMLHYLYDVVAVVLIGAKVIFLLVFVSKKIVLTRANVICQ